ncbi:hypothetical protein GCM10023089_27430 [Quisquiliibacterium transsilvanicum]
MAITGGLLHPASISTVSVAQAAIRAGVGQRVMGISGRRMGSGHSKPGVLRAATRGNRARKPAAIATASVGYVRQRTDHRPDVADPVFLAGAGVAMPSRITRNR